MTCEYCGRDFPDEELTEVQNGDLVCDDCLREHFVECDDCGAYVPEDEASRTEDGDLVCQDCVDNHYVVCDHCGDLVRDDRAVDVDDGELLVCGYCADRYYYRCDDCGRYVSSDHVHSDGSRDICDDCMDNWIVCADCGDLVPCEDSVEVNGEYYCDYCAMSHQSGVHDYDYKPTPEIEREPGDARSCLTFGVELEVDKGTDVRGTAEEVTAVGRGRVYCKHDGSLDDGFEIVSHPGSLRHHLETMPWDDIARTCLDNDFESHDAGTCGLHVHIGIRELGWEAAGRLVVLVDAVWPELVTFSRRSDSQLNHWASRPLIPEGPEDLTTRALRTEQAGRYQAVNLTNSSTVELRIFRGSLVTETIRATIQLANNLALYALEHSAEECQAATFADVLAVDLSDDLASYCNKRNISVPARLTMT